MPSFAIPAAASPLTNPALDRRPRESHDDSPEHDNCAAEPQAARDRSPNDGLAPQTHHYQIDADLFADDAGPGCRG
jgi:hypothetical protein